MEMSTEEVRIEMSRYLGRDGGWGLTIENADGSIMVEVRLTDQEFSHIVGGRSVKTPAEVSR